MLTPETVRAVARLLHETDLSEIEIETTGFSDSETPDDAPRVRLQMRRGSSPVAPRRAASPIAPAIAAPPASTPAPATLIVSPSVGVFRAGDKALQIGDAVQKKQVVGRVEALKNSDGCTVAGRGAH